MISCTIGHAISPIANPTADFRQIFEYLEVRLDFEQFWKPTLTVRFNGVFSLSNSSSMKKGCTVFVYVFQSALIAVLGPAFENIHGIGDVPDLIAFQPFQNFTNLRLILLGSQIIKEWRE